MIAKGQIKSEKVYENDSVLAFKDINPQSPVHIVVIPKEHIMTCADDITEENSAAIAKIFEAIPKIAAVSGLSNGYRIISNCKKDACQSVMHIHFHILGGRQLSGEMG